MDNNEHRETFIEFLKRDDVWPAAKEAGIGLVCTYAGVLIKKHIHSTIGFVIMVIGLILVTHASSIIGVNNNKDQN